METPRGVVACNGFYAIDSLLSAMNILGDIKSKIEISRRLADIDLAQTSAIRDLEMDINGEAGIDSKKVLLAARQAIA